MPGKYCSPLILIFAGHCLAQTSKFSLPAVYSTSGEIRSRVTKLEKLAPATSYSLLFSVDSPAALGPEARVAVSIVEGGRVLLGKTLHAGDADLYGFFRTTRGAELRVTAEGASAARYHLQINRWPLAAGPNHTWQDATAITLGQVVTAASDELEYLPLPGTSRKEMVSAPAGEHWYRFEFDAPRPKLVFFQVELTDRDDIPVDVSIFRDRTPASWKSIPRARIRSRSRTKCRRCPATSSRRASSGRRGPTMSACAPTIPSTNSAHASTTPRLTAIRSEAVRTAVDYIMGAGDSWFANTPRRGGAFDRVAGVHQETSLCVACHASHFSQRAQLYSIANGYPVVQRQQLQFLEERFYNNPRPFYGFEKQGAVWSRVISAPANVLSRISVLTSLFEQNVSGVERSA